MLCTESASPAFIWILRYQNSDTEYETPIGYHHPDSYYDDDEQPLYHDSRRSPKRRLLPATPQGTFMPVSLSCTAFSVKTKRHQSIKLSTRGHQLSAMIRGES